ncbi:hypothetical protein A7975_04045 [Bacillus sp. FJAT-26390]|nr:hypothetical protein A7975_04045 [Bacillus sp. FJAT-26390]
MLVFITLIVPLLGTLWFASMIMLLKNLKNNKSIQRSFIVSLFLTFIFIFSAMFAIMATVQFHV